MVTSRLISLCHTTKLCDVFANRVLKSNLKKKKKIDIVGQKTKDSQSNPRQKAYSTIPNLKLLYKTIVIKSALY